MRSKSKMAGVIPAIILALVLWGFGFLPWWAFFLPLLAVVELEFTTQTR